MGQNNCCQINNRQANSITQQEIDDLQFQKLDFNRGSTYKKLESISTDITQICNISKNHNLLISRIIANKQEHLIRILKDIEDKEELTKYVVHLETMDFELIDSLYYNLIKKNKEENEDFYSKQYRYEKIQNVDDINQIDEPNYEKYFKAGLDMIKNKEMGLLLMIGGKNVRFHQQMNKGTCNLGLPSQKSLVQIIFERIKKLNQLASLDKDKTNSSVQLYIMLNEENAPEVRHYIKKNKYFGIDPECVTFFCQQSLPIVDEEGKFLMKSNLSIHFTPNGSADFFQSMISHKIIPNMLKNKLKYLHVLGIDNMLIKPLDPFFLGYTKYHDKEITCKVVERSTVDEDCQVFIKRVLQQQEGSTEPCQQQILTQHCKELTQEIESSPDDYEKNILNSPMFTNNVIFKIDFINNLVGDNQRRFKYTQKYHIIRRKYDFYDLSEKSVQKSQIDNALCFEKEIGDIIQLTEQENVQLLKVNRDEEFSPIIYQRGIYSPEDSVINLSNLHKKWLGLDERNSQERDIVEISPEVSYNGEQLDDIIRLLDRYSKISYPLHIVSIQNLMEQLQKQKESIK